MGLCLEGGGAWDGMGWEGGREIELCASTWDERDEWDELTREGVCGFMVSIRYLVST